MSETVKGDYVMWSCMMILALAQRIAELELRLDADAKGWDQVLAQIKAARPSNRGSMAETARSQEPNPSILRIVVTDMLDLLIFRPAHTVGFWG